MTKIQIMTRHAICLAGLAITGLSAVAAQSPDAALDKLQVGPQVHRHKAGQPREVRRLAYGAEASLTAMIPTNGIQRSPYMAQRVYRVRCVPGSPVMVELPMGEEASQIWYDKQWWKAESTPGSNRVLICALDADGVRGRKTNIHIETLPSNLRLSFQAEACGEDQDPPGVISIYMDGTDLEAKARVEASGRALRDATQFKQAMNEEMKANFEAWKAKAVTQMKDTYKFEKGKLGLERVVSDGTQTFISIKTTEQAALKLKNRDNAEETLNYEVKNGTYSVNHVLLEGEEFILVVGKETATIRPK